MVIGDAVRVSHRMARIVFGIGSLFAATGVGLGAFGAHTLKTKIPADLLDVFEIGVRYQIYHALGLMALAWAIKQWPDTKLNLAAWLMIAGTITFSGTLVLLALTGIRWLGAITPIGGLMLIAGWLLTAWCVVSSNRR